LGSLAALVVLVGLLFAAFGIVVSRVPEYRVQLQDWINERSGLVVEFKTISARLRFYGPELVFDQAVVRTPDRTQVLAVARRGSVGFDLWNAIRTGRLTAGRFRLDGPQIGLIRTREGRIQLLGQSALPENADRPFALERLPTGLFDVRRAVVSFRDEITSRGPWSLSGVNFKLARDPKALRLRGDATLPQQLGKRLEFSATAEGALEDSKKLVSSFKVDGEGLDLAGWADVLPNQWPVPEAGHGNLQLSGALRGAELTEVAAVADFARVTAVPGWSLPLPGAEPMKQPNSDANSDDDADDAPAAPAPIEATEPTEVEPAPPVPASAMLSYERVAFRVSAKRDGDAWRGTLDNAELRTADDVWTSDRIAADWQRSADGSLKIGGKADRIALGPLWPLLAYLPENETNAKVRALGATGTIKDLSFAFERATAEAKPTFDVEAKLDGVGWKPVARIPGMSGLGGTVRGTQSEGQWRVAARNAQFVLPRLFPKPLEATSVDGEIEWRRDDAGLHLGGQKFHLQGPDGEATASFAATIPADGSSPLLKVNATGQHLNVASTARYVPVGLLGPRTVDWFEQAFVRGEVKTAEFVYDGPTRSFPFRDRSGTFLARGHVEDATLQYQPDWPAATDIVGDVEFRNEGMQIHASAAKVGNVQASAATATIADLKQTRLVIKAAAQGGVHDALTFLKASPLGPKLGDAFARLDGQGPMQAQVSLDLPIRRMQDRRIEVATRVDGATVTMQGIDASVQGLQGSLTVRNALPAVANLHGTWSGGPIAAKIEPKEPSSSLLTVQGHVDAAQLQSLLGLPSTVKFSGATQWQMSTLLIESDERAAPERIVRIDSDLQGLGISLPSPLGKTETAAVPLQLSLILQDDEVLARGSLGNVRSLVRVARSGDAWALDRGTVRADGVAPALPDHRGLRIEGTVERFVLDEWLALKPPAGSGGKPLSDYLQAASVTVDDFGLLGYRVADVRGMLQATPSGWRVDLNGPNAAGQVLIPESFTGSQALRSTLERLNMQKATDAESSSSAEPDSDTDPRNLPNLELYVADLRVGPRHVGAVELKATRVPQGIRIDNATIIGEAVRADGKGQWLMTADGPQSSLEATLTSTDVSATLRSLNSPEFMQARLGRIHANLTWPGGFGENILARASGAISVDAETGQIVNLQPGAGRMLGLFSLAALPRRLALDFSDLTDKGLAFDSVHGDFELRAGNAFTSNLLLRGPAAEIGIAGRTGLGTRDYDQTAVVTGNLGVSLPVAGALAGGPAVGAAVLLFSQVFKEPLKGFTRGYYRITGPWDDPVVERVDAAEVKAENAGQKPGASQ
jgi:uncharacterized protein (TIGR02099 family)